MRNVVLNHISSIGCCNPLVTKLNNWNIGLPYSFLAPFPPPALWFHDFHSRDFHPCTGAGASIPPEAMVRSPQDGRMRPPNF